MSSFVSWFRWNRFFEQTPISGFGYIVSADKIWEIVFWYVSICVFLIGVTINIYDSSVKYGQKNTLTTFEPIAKTEHLHLPNFTIDLYLPLIELGSFKLRYKITQTNQVPTKSLLLNFSTRYDPEQSYTIDDLWDIYIYGSTSTYYDIFNSLIKRGEEALERFDLVRQPRNQHSGNLYSPETFSQWQRSLAADRNILDEIRKNQYKMNLMEIQKSIPYQIEAPLRARIDTNLFLKLILLESMKKEKKPQELIKEQFLIQGELSNKSTASEILKQHDWTMEELVAETLSSLSQLFYIALSHPSATATLTDVSVDPRNGLKLEFGLGLKLQFEITLHKKVQQLELELHSYMHLWLDRILDWYYSNEHWAWDSDELDIISVLAVEQILSIFNYNYYNSESVVSKQEFNFKTLVPSGSDLDVNVRPIWQTSSNTDDCVPDSLEWCSKKCRFELHKTQCRCYQWFIEPIDEAKICDKPCEVLGFDECIEKCNPCHRQILDILSQDTLYTDMDRRRHQLFKYSFSIPEDMFPHLLREYEMSGNEFLANLGALLDFWVGINILAMMHVVMYIIMKQVDCFKNNKITSDNTESVRKLEQLQAIRAETLSQINKARENAFNSDASSNNNMRFDWLIHNEFFEQTNISVFGFISAAGNKLEASFWWLIMIIFCIVTVLNVGNEFILYSTSPTQTILTFGSNAQNTEMPNFTITIKTPLAQFSTRNPIYGLRANTKLNQATQSAAQYFLCLFTLDVEDASYDTYMFEYNLAYLLNSTNWDVQESDDGFTNASDWLPDLEHASMEFYTFLGRISLNQIEKQTQMNSSLLKEFNLLLNGPIRSRFRDAAQRSMLLESLKTGEHPNQKLYASFKQTTFLNYAQPVFEDNTKLMAKIEAKTLYRQVQHDIMKMVHINSNPPGLQTTFIDWDYNMNMDQETTFQMTLPPDQSQITIQIRYFIHEWWATIIDTFKQYFKSIGKANQFQCRGMRMDDIRAKHVKAIQRKLSGFDYTWLRLAGEDTGFELTPDEDVQFNLRPTTQFYSKTHMCYDGSYSECVAKCVIEKQMALCGCVPYPSLYLTSDHTVPVCIAPCASDSERNGCATKCESLVVRSCKSTLYLLHHVSQKGLYELEDPTYSFTITKEELDYAVYTEQYSLTIGTFMTRLAGLCEIWLGINLLTLVHAFFYIIKQASIYMNMNTKSHSKPAAHQRQANKCLEVQKLEKRLIERLDTMIKELKLEILKEENVENA